MTTIDLQSVETRIANGERISVYLDAEILRQVKALLRRVKLDPRRDGRDVLDVTDPEMRMRYFAKRGVSVDEFGGLLAGHGLTPFRIGDFDTIAGIIACAVEHTSERLSKREQARRGAIARGIADAEADRLANEFERVRRNRERGYACPGCGDLARHSGFNWQGRCECGEVYVCRDRRPEEIMNEAGNIAAAADECAPF